MSENKLVDAYKQALEAIVPTDPATASKQLHTISAMADTVLNEQPDFTAALWAKADILLYNREYEAALPYFKQLIKAKTGNEDIENSFAECLYHTGHYQEAIPYLEERCQQYETDIVFGFMLSYSLFKTGQTARALTHYHRLLDDFEDLATFFPKEMKEMVTYTSQKAKQATCSIAWYSLFDIFSFYCYGK